MMMRTAGELSTPTPPSYLTLPIHHFYLLIVSGARSLSLLSLWSFDLHEITVLPEKALDHYHLNQIYAVEL
ncbi:hypothetical protein PAMP_018650 [Pampus punctatissimus]